jgi:hypothetical protein
MKKYRTITMGLFFALYNLNAGATLCPDPNTSSLQWGVPPLPWIENPFSPNGPQGEENTHFVRANILVAGLGRGVVCTYRISVGEYSIWWPVLTKIPARSDYRWIDTLGGFVCTDGIGHCEFHVAL